MQVTLTTNNDIFSILGMGLTDMKIELRGQFLYFTEYDKTDANDILE